MQTFCIKASTNSDLMCYAGQCVVGSSVHLSDFRKQLWDSIRRDRGWRNYNIVDIHQTGLFGHREIMVVCTADREGIWTSSLPG